MQWTSHCVPWQIDFVGVLFGLWPRFLCCFGVLPFASLFPLAKRKSGWGICGSSCLVGFCCFFVCSFNRFAALMDLICPCTNVFPAYAHVRTEPLARHRPHSRKKKETEHIEGRKSACALKLRSHTGHVSSFWTAGFHEGNGYLGW